MQMRRFVALLTATIACSSDPLSAPDNEIPAVPDNPLISILASEASTWTMSRLGSDASSPYRINETTCNGLPTHTDVVDSLFFHGDGTYRRVYRSLSRIWRTNGVPAPEEMNLRHKWEHNGAVTGEGDVLTLIVTHAQQNDEPFAPFTGYYNTRIFSISGAKFSAPETLGTGCAGQRIATEAVFTRVSE
jgi:hypothetical protein